MTRLPEIADLNTVLEMEAEDLAPVILMYLQKQQNINRYNFSLLDSSVYGELGKNSEAYAERLMEGWLWLEREGFIAPKPGITGDWYFVTRKGRAVINAQDFTVYRKANLFPSDLDPILIQMTKPLFIRGSYDTAVFEAFKEVEIRVRANSKLDDGDYGIDLMKKAFGPTGPLTDKIAPKGEQDRMRDLFVGAIGTFKNPTSHRRVAFNDPDEVVDIIRFANQLLRITDRSIQSI